MKRFFIALVITFGLLGLLRPWKSNFQDRSNKSPGNLTRTENFTSLENESTIHTRTKSHIRPLSEMPSIEETTELFTTTMIPLVDLPADQSAPERISQINKLIHQTGVDPARLRLILRAGDPAHEWRFKDELLLRNLTANSVLKYVCGRTKLHCHVRENGIVELTTTFDPEPDPDPRVEEPEASGNSAHQPDVDDPFTEPSGGR